MAVSVGSVFASVQGALSGPSLDTPSTLKLLQAWQFQLFFWLSRLTLPKTVFPSFSILSSLTLDLGGWGEENFYLLHGASRVSWFISRYRIDAFRCLFHHFLFLLWACSVLCVFPSTACPPWHALHHPSSSCLSLCPLQIFTHSVSPVPHLKNT